MELPIYKTVVIPYTFEVNPYANWFEYELSRNDSIYHLRNKAEVIFDRCIHYDGDEWLSASVAKLTYFENGELRSIACVNGTERRVFRWVRELPDYLNGSIYRSTHQFLKDLYVNVTLSISYGTPQSYPQDLQATYFSPSDLLFRVENVSVHNVEIECFAEDSFNIAKTTDDVYVELMCQRTIGKFVDFISVRSGSVRYDFESKALPSLLKNGSKKYSTSAFQISPLIFVGRVEFPGPPVFTAKHMVNTESYFITPLTQADAESKIRRLLYTKKENRTTNIRLSETKTVTVLDSVSIFVFSIEIILAVIWNCNAGHCKIYAQSSTNP